MRELRGHHLFCTTLFSGSGYNAAFIQNMKELVEGLEAGERFHLCQGHDHVCAACPNRLPEGCALGTEDVEAQDHAAMEVLDLRLGQELDRKELYARLDGLSEWEFQRVCGGCRWQKEGLCTYELFRERVSAKP